MGNRGSVMPSKSSSTDSDSSSHCDTKTLVRSEGFRPTTTLDWLVAGRRAEERELLDDALQCYAAATLCGPDGTLGHKRAAMLHARRGHIQAAIREWEHYIDAVPHDWFAVTELARCYDIAGDDDLGVRMRSRLPIQDSVTAPPVEDGDENRRQFAERCEAERQRRHNWGNFVSGNRRKYIKSAAPSPFSY